MNLLTERKFQHNRSDLYILNKKDKNMFYSYCHPNTNRHCKRTGRENRKIWRLNDLCIVTVLIGSLGKFQKNPCAKLENSVNRTKFLPKNAAITLPVIYNEKGSNSTLKPLVL